MRMPTRIRTGASMPESEVARTGSRSSRPAKTSGIPHAAQKRSLGGYVVAQAGQTSEPGSELGDVRAIDPVAPNAGVPVRQPDDDPRRARPRLGVGDVRLRRVG